MNCGHHVPGIGPVMLGIYIMFRSAITAAKSVPDPTLIFSAALGLDPDPAEPDAEVVGDPVLEGELSEPDVEAEDPDSEAVALADGEEDVGVIDGPGPAVIMSPFPPGYVPPPAAVKSCGTWVSLLAKKYMAAAGVWPKFDSSKKYVKLNCARFVAL